MSIFGVFRKNFLVHATHAVHLPVCRFGDDILSNTGCLCSGTVGWKRYA